MRLNKEPPDDIPVVEYAGLGDTNSSAAVVPLSRYPGASSERGYFARRPSRGGGGGGGDAGAGGNTGWGASTPTAPAGKEMEDANEEDEDLSKIKNAGDLGEDDNCVVCLSGEGGILLSFSCIDGRKNFPFVLYFVEKIVVQFSFFSSLFRTLPGRCSSIRKTNANTASVRDGQNWLVVCDMVVLRPTPL